MKKFLSPAKAWEKSMCLSHTWITIWFIKQLKITKIIFFSNTSFSFKKVGVKE